MKKAFFSMSSVLTALHRGLSGKTGGLTVADLEDGSFFFGCGEPHLFRPDYEGMVCAPEELDWCREDDKDTLTDAAFISALSHEVAKKNFCTYSFKGYRHTKCSPNALLALSILRQLVVKAKEQNRMFWQTGNQWELASKLIPNGYVCWMQGEWVSECEEHKNLGPKVLNVCRKLGFELTEAQLARLDYFDENKE